MSVVSAHTHRLLTDKAQFFEKSLAALIAFAVLTASSHVAVPVGPVPMTMQTLAVTLTGVFLGPRFGAAVVAFWVAAGFSGLPIFAMGNGGIAALTGPTAGFLYSFPVIAAMAACSAYTLLLSPGIASTLRFCGMLSFLVSDSLLVFCTFRQNGEKPWQAGVVMSSYIAAQTLLCMGFSL